MCVGICENRSIDIHELIECDSTRFVTLYISIGTEIRKNFTGKEHDDEIALNYFGARYLDTMLGMWTSVDPKRQFASPYLYAGNGYNPVNGVDEDGNRVFGTYNRSTREVYLQDESPKRGSFTFFAVSGYKTNPNEFGGPIPKGFYTIISDPTKGKHPNWFGLFKNDDGRFDDKVQEGEGVGRGQFRLHRYSSGTNGCISATTETVDDYLDVVKWIQSTETQTVKDVDGVSHTDFGEIEVVTDED